MYNTLLIFIDNIFAERKRINKNLYISFGENIIFYKFKSLSIFQKTLFSQGLYENNKSTESTE